MLAALAVRKNGKTRTNTKESRIGPTHRWIVRVKNSHYGSLNPKANYKKALSLEEILTSAPAVSKAAAA